MRADPDGIFQGLLPLGFATQCLGLEFYPIILVPMSQPALKTRLQSLFAFSVLSPTSQLPTGTSRLIPRGMDYDGYDALLHYIFKQVRVSTHPTGLSVFTASIA